MKYFLAYSIVLIFLLKAASSYSQSIAYLDSLESQLAIKMHDTARVSLLLSLANSYTFKNFKKSLAYAKEATFLADQANDQDLKLRAHRELGLIFSLGGDYTSALSHETLALQLGIDKKDSTEIGRSYSNIGNYYYEIGVYDDAYFYLTTAYSILNKGTISKDEEQFQKTIPCS